MKDKRSKHVLQMVISAVVMIAIVAGYLLISGSLGGKQGPDFGQDYVNADVPTVRIALDEFIGWKSLVYANGGDRKSVV